MELNYLKKWELKSLQPPYDSYIKEIKESGSKIDVVIKMLANLNLKKDLSIVILCGGIVEGSMGNLLNC